MILQKPFKRKLYKRLKTLASKLRFDTVRFKISVLYTMILGVVLILYMTILYVSLYANLISMFDTAQIAKLEKLKSTIDSYAEIIGDDEKAFTFTIKKALDLTAEHPNADKISELHKFWKKKFYILNLDNDYIAFMDKKGKVIAYSSNMDEVILDLFRKNFLPLDKNQEFKKNIRTNGLRLRIVSKMFVYNDKFEYYVQMGSSMETIAQTMTVRFYYRLIPIPLILLLGFFIGNLFASRVLKPVEDITKTAERISRKDLKLRVSTKDLDKEMKQLGHAFNSMISRLEQSFVLIERFSANVAHELKTPLSVMRLELELALWEERNPEEYKNAIKITLEEIGRMLRIIQDLFLLSNLDFQQGVFNFERIDCCNFIDEIYRNTKILADQKEIEMRLSLPKEPAYINADKTHLKRLFLNLIHNAIKFNKKKGSIDLVVEPNAKDVLVSVADSGTGIAEKDLPFIFERFFHCDIDQDEYERGSGLGLSIVKSIAKIHRGEVKVISELGKGSVFTVAVPLA